MAGSAFYTSQTQLLANYGTGQTIINIVNLSRRYAEFLQETAQMVSPIDTGMPIKSPALSHSHADDECRLQYY